MLRSGTSIRRVQAHLNQFLSLFSRMYEYLVVFQLPIQKRVSTSICRPAATFDVQEIALDNVDSNSSASNKHNLPWSVINLGL